MNVTARTVVHKYKVIKNTSYTLQGLAEHESYHHSSITIDYWGGADGPYACEQTLARNRQAEGCKEVKKRNDGHLFVRRQEINISRFELSSTLVCKNHILIVVYCLNYWLISFAKYSCRNVLFSFETRVSCLLRFIDRPVCVLSLGSGFGLTLPSSIFQF